MHERKAEVASTGHNSSLKVGVWDFLGTIAGGLSAVLLIIGNLEWLIPFAKRLDNDTLYLVTAGIISGTAHSLLRRQNHPLLRHFLTAFISIFIIQWVANFIAWRHLYSKSFQPYAIGFLLYIIPFILINFAGDKLRSRPSPSEIHSTGEI